MEYYLHYVLKRPILFIAIIAFTLAIPKFLKMGIVLWQRFQFLREDESNSLGITAGNLLARQIFIHRIDTKIDVWTYLRAGESAYDMMNDQIRLPKIIDTSYSVRAVAEAYHELGHALYYSQMSYKKRQANIELTKSNNAIIWVMTYIGVGSMILIPMFLSEYSMFGILFGFFCLLAVFGIQLRNIKEEKEASATALQMMRGDGFTEEEIRVAKRYLNAYLNTYRIEVALNITRTIFVILMVLLEANGKGGEGEGSK